MIEDQIQDILNSIDEEPRMKRGWVFTELTAEQAEVAIECAICGRPIEMFALSNGTFYSSGNSVAPISEEGESCQRCFNLLVIPARMYSAQTNNENNVVFDFGEER